MCADFRVTVKHFWGPPTLKGKFWNLDHETNHSTLLCLHYRIRVRLLNKAASPTKQFYFLPRKKDKNTRTTCNVVRVDNVDTHFLRMSLQKWKVSRSSFGLFNRGPSRMFLTKNDRKPPDIVPLSIRSIRGIGCLSIVS